MIKIFKMQYKKILFAAIAVVTVTFLPGKSNAIDYDIYQVENQEEGVAQPAEKIAYLSFDDGPSSVTDTLLDNLKEKNVKATFFTVAETTLSEKERDEMYKRIVDEGHVLGLHTYSHRNYNEIYSSGEAFINNLKSLQEMLKNITGYESKTFRFPAGSNNIYCNKSKYDYIVSESKNMGWRFFDWNVDVQDSFGGKKSKQYIVENVVKQSKQFNQPVILLHDIPTTKTSVQAIPEIVDELTKLGYRFDTLDHKAEDVHQTRK